MGTLPASQAFDMHMTEQQGLRCVYIGIAAGSVYIGFFTCVQLVQHIKLLGYIYNTFAAAQTKCSSTRATGNTSRLLTN